ncbi:MAG: hypothetical protein WAX38_03215 [Minisyncoccia bacterium]
MKRNFRLVAMTVFIVSIATSAQKFQELPYTKYSLLTHDTKPQYSGLDSDELVMNDASEHLYKAPALKIASLTSQLASRLVSAVMPTVVSGASGGGRTKSRPSSSNGSGNNTQQRESPAPAPQPVPVTRKECKMVEKKKPADSAKPAGDTAKTGIPGGGAPQPAPEKKDEPKKPETDPLDAQCEKETQEEMKKVCEGDGTPDFKPDAPPQSCPSGCHYNNKIPGAAAPTAPGASTGGTKPKAPSFPSMQQPQQESEDSMIDRMLKFLKPPVKKVDPEQLAPKKNTPAECKKQYDDKFDLYTGDGMRAKLPVDKSLVPGFKGKPNAKSCLSRSQILFETGGGPGLTKAHKDACLKKCNDGIALLPKSLTTGPSGAGGLEVCGEIGAPDTYSVVCRKVTPAQEEKQPEQKPEDAKPEPEKVEYEEVCENVTTYEYPNGGNGSGGGGGGNGGGGNNGGGGSGSGGGASGGGSPAGSGGGAPSGGSPSGTGGQMPQVPTQPPVSPQQIDLTKATTPPVCADDSARTLTVVKGESTSLNWSVLSSGTLKTTVSYTSKVAGKNTPIKGTLGEVQDGSTEVSPDTDTTYTLKATNEIGSVTCKSIKVLVKTDVAEVDDFTGKKIVLSCSPKAVTRGSDATIRWTCPTLSKKSIGVSTQDGTFTTNNAVRGVATVSPLRTSLYSVKCTDLQEEDIGSASCSITVSDTTTNATSAPSVQLYADPVVVPSGEEVKVTWKSKNSVSCVIYGPGCDTYGTESLKCFKEVGLSGSIVGRVYGPTKFNAVCKNAQRVTTTQSITLDVLEDGSASEE